MPKQLLIICLAIFSNLSIANTLKPFSSDGCSMFPDGTLSDSERWLDCCIAHDLAYWKGGSYEQRMDADQELLSCLENLGEPGIGLLMLTGVRLGGTPFIPTSFRWGYGWDYPLFYRRLTDEEQALIDRTLKKQKQ